MFTASLEVKIHIIGILRLLLNILIKPLLKILFLLITLPIKPIISISLPRLRLKIIPVRNPLVPRNLVAPLIPYLLVYPMPIIHQILMKLQHELIRLLLIQIQVAKFHP
jgi:hypothetical protein